MANIVIDPLIAMTPPDNATKADVEVWLENLDAWLTEALTAPFIWLHYQHSSELLEANGQFPNFAQLRLLNNKYHPDLNPGQLARKVNEFFRDDAFDLKDRLKHLDFVTECEASSITIKPDQFITRLPNYLDNDLRMVFADCCACKHIQYPFGQNLHVATFALVDSSKEITISVVILDALPDFARPSDNRITQRFPLLITPDDLQPLIDIVELWSKGEQGIIYAITKQFEKSRPTNNINPLKFQSGLHFIKSVNDRGLDNNEIVLRSIIRAVSDIIADRARDIPGYRLHHFRKSEAADGPQLVRDADQAKAWRLMVSKHGAGWRLHYWQIPTPEGSVIEFANVCKESEREIY